MSEGPGIVMDGGDESDPDAPPNIDELKAFLAPFSAIPADHSIAKGTAPEPVRRAFEGWTSVFDNRDPICLGWFPQGVPSMKQLSGTIAGSADVRFRGFRTVSEVDYWIGILVDGGLGCFFVVYQAPAECPKRCMTAHGWKRCVHFVGTATGSASDAERGYLTLRDNVMKDDRAPNERWSFEGGRATRKS